MGPDRGAGRYVGGRSIGELASSPLLRASDPWLDDWDRAFVDGDRGLRSSHRLTRMWRCNESQWAPAA